MFRIVRRVAVVAVAILSLLGAYAVPAASGAPDSRERGPCRWTGDAPIHVEKGGEYAFKFSAPSQDQIGEVGVALAYSVDETIGIPIVRVSAPGLDLPTWGGLESGDIMRSVRFRYVSSDMEVQISGIDGTGDFCFMLGPESLLDGSGLGPELARQIQVGVPKVDTISAPETGIEYSSNRVYYVADTVSGQNYEVVLTRDVPDNFPMSVSAWDENNNWLNGADCPAQAFECAFSFRAPGIRAYPRADDSGKGGNAYTLCIRKPGTKCDVVRLSGADRFEASASASAMTFGEGVDVAYVASGRVFPDALSVATVAGGTPGPVLLVDTNTIPAAIAAELTRLKPKKIVIAGGPTTVTPAVQTALAAYTSGSVARWSGSDRYATSAAVSQAGFPAGAKVAYVASGLVFPDALSGAPVGAKTGGPILLTSTTRLPASVATELTRLKPEEIVILGGPASVSDAVAKQLAGYASTGSVARWAGADRYETSATISAQTYDPGVPFVYITSGLVFPDALSAAPAAGKRGGPVLLVNDTSIPASIDAELKRLKPHAIFVVGGPNSVSESVQASLAAYLS